MVGTKTFFGSERAEDDIEAGPSSIPFSGTQVEAAKTGRSANIQMRAVLPLAILICGLPEAGTA